MWMWHSLVAYLDVATSNKKVPHQNSICSLWSHYLEAPLSYGVFFDVAVCHQMHHVMTAWDRYGPSNQIAHTHTQIREQEKEIIRFVT
jgi:hypothetical protein